MFVGVVRVDVVGLFICCVIVEGVCVYVGVVGVAVVSAVCCCLWCVCCCCVLLIIVVVDCCS